MVKVYYLDELKKFGNSIGINVPKKEFSMIGQTENWKRGTKVRVLIEILPDDFKEDTEVVNIFNAPGVIKQPKIKPSKKQPEVVYDTPRPPNDPFSSSSEVVFEDEIPDEPTMDNLKNLNLKGQSLEKE